MRGSVRLRNPTPVTVTLLRGHTEPREISACGHLGNFTLSPSRIPTPDPPAGTAPLRPSPAPQHPARPHGPPLRFWNAASPSHRPGFALPSLCLDCPSRLSRPHPCKVPQSPLAASSTRFSLCTRLSPTLTGSPQFSPAGGGAPRRARA